MKDFLKQNQSVARFPSMSFATLNENPRSASLFEIFKKFLEKMFTDGKLKMGERKRKVALSVGAEV